MPQKQGLGPMHQGELTVLFSRTPQMAGWRKSSKKQGEIGISLHLTLKLVLPPLFNIVGRSFNIGPKLKVLGVAQNIQGTLSFH